MNNNEILKEFARILTENKQKLLINKAFKNMLEEAETRCRKGTIEYYIKVFKSMESWLKDNSILYIEDITKQILNNYIKYLKHVKKYKNNSSNKHIEVIKHITKYNYDNELSAANHIANFKKLKNDNVETSFINNNQINMIINYLDNLNLNNIVTLRNVLSIYLMKDTGARLNEILHIECNNINIEKSSIYLNFTKTGKPRKVYLSKRCINLLKDYLSHFKLKGSKYLLINFKTKEIVFKTTIYEFIEQIRKDLNIEISISPHKWRHTLASKLVNENVNISIVQKVLGHASLEITKRYLHAEEEHIQECVLNVIN